MSYNDFAIILTWPDATIRGDEKWMMFFKKIGIVKNLNFKVGHTGVVLVNNDSGEMLFYDFGRYITPRGYGRARSKDSDPKLTIKMKADISDNTIQNIAEIAAYFEELKPAMFGEGRLFFSIATNISFHLAKQFGDDWVQRGSYPYGAVARNNNNCSRFITRLLIKASTKYHFLHSINLPETIKASPISNIVNANKDRIVNSYSPEDGLQTFRMNRWHSFLFLIQQLGDNVFRQRASKLPNDIIIGAMTFVTKPINVPKGAKYLGGVGEGAWYSIKQLQNAVEICRFNRAGELEYIVMGNPDRQIDLESEWEITYDSHLLFTHVLQNNTKIRITHTDQVSLSEYNIANIRERYA